MLKNVNRKVLWIFLIVVAVLAGGWLWLDSRRVTPILMYHHVGPNSEHRVDTVTPENFSGQMRYLSEHGYHVMPLREYAQAVIDGRRLPRKTVVLTFDDAYEDNYHNAFPVLKTHGFPWTLFIPSDLVGAPGHLSESQILEMMTAGMDIGSHTRRHQYLPDIANPAIREDEIAASRKILEDRFRTRVDIFSYPIGGYSDMIQAEVRKAGYILAFTTNRADFRNTDRWALTRIKITDKNQGFLFGAKLSGLYNIVRKPKPSH